MKIETERLIITEFTMDMAEAVHLNSLDEDNRRFVPDEVFETVEEAADTVGFLMGVYENGDGPLVYPVLLKDGTYIGYVQAIPFDDGTWEVGYHIGANYTKKGYATEAVKAFLPIIMPSWGFLKSPVSALRITRLLSRLWSAAALSRNLKVSALTRVRNA